MSHCFEICHYQQNVPQHHYLLDTLVYTSYATLLSAIPWNIPHESFEFSRYTCEPLGENVYQDNKHAFYIHINTYQCKNPIVPEEEGWFGQPKYSTPSKNHPTLCRFLLLYILH